MEFISPVAALCQIKSTPSVSAWEKVCGGASQPCLTLTAGNSFLASSRACLLSRSSCCASCDSQQQPPASSRRVSVRAVLTSCRIQRGSPGCYIKASDSVSVCQPVIDRCPLSAGVRQGGGVLSMRRWADWSLGNKLSPRRGLADSQQSSQVNSCSH